VDLLDKKIKLKKKRGRNAIASPARRESAKKWPILVLDHCRGGGIEIHLEHRVIFPREERSPCATDEGGKLKWWVEEKGAGSQLRESALCGLEIRDRGRKHFRPGDMGEEGEGDPVARIIRDDSRKRGDLVWGNSSQSRSGRPSSSDCGD